MRHDTAAKYEPMVDFIRRYTQEHGYSPTIREMQTGLALSSTSVANYWTHRLQQMGRITWEEGASRTVRIIDDDVVDLVIHLTRDEARMVGEAMGDDEPKTVLMQAVRDRLSGLVPMAQVDGTKVVSPSTGLRR